MAELSIGGRRAFTRIAFVLFIGIVGFVATPAPPASADWPPTEGADLTDVNNWPDDPGYAGDWNLWSFIPTENVDKVSDYELSIGSGIHADRAWQLNTGNRDVIIAVLDSGIRWRERDLVNKYYLNRAELPVPDMACGTAVGPDPYDVNGDGHFNVQDYTTATGHTQPTADLICDPGVTDANANGILDPQDLIMTFSDDIDDDDNGWIDDISGWDMFDDDNDPNDDTDFGHGSGEARDSAAETDNGISSPGVCPECSILMVRVGDSFVVDSNDFAMGTIFGVDSGAAVIQEALGSINGTALMHEAIEYAWRQDVAIVASAADEDSFHANLPGSVNHTIYVHANTFNKTSREASDTFLAFNNCTNYGPQLLLSTPGTGCSSEATGKTSGIVGLMYSAALDAGIPAPRGEFGDTDAFRTRVLKSEEIKQLLLMTVDDIYDPADATDPDKYPTFMGWENRFGYGRTNVRNALDEIYAGRIPPVVDVQGPDWFEVINPASTPTIDIIGEISYRTDRFDSYDYVVEWAPGAEPLPEQWTTLAEGMNETAAIDGTLASWDVRDLNIDNPQLPEPDVDVYRRMVTVRVRVTLHSADGALEGTAGEIRRAFHIVNDPGVRPGFPIKLDGSGEASPTITDLDGDGAMELVIPDSAGTIHVFDGDGNYVSGWPQQLDVISHLNENNADNHRQTAAIRAGGVPGDVREPIMHGSAIGDLDGDGPDGRSIVVATFNGLIYAFGADGARRANFPVSLDPANAANTDEDHTLDTGVFGAPVLADMDNDGDLEIIVGAMDGHIYIWHHDGSEMAGWPVQLTDGAKAARIVQTPSVGDIDGDGQNEIVCGTNEDYDGRGRMYALNADGTLLPTWPRSLTSVSVLPMVGTGMPNSSALADVDEDGIVDVAAVGIVALPTIIRGDGSVVGIMENNPFGDNTNSDDAPSFVAISNGSFGDLDNNGNVDVVWGGAGLGFAEAFAGSGERVNFDHQVGVWDSRTRQYLPGFPRRADDHQFFMNPAVADIDGDDLPEVISGSGGYYLRAWNADGVEPEGWPKFTGGWIIASPAVGDLDGDGTLEVATATREGYLWVWNTTGRTDGRVDWANFHHDDHNTGNFEMPIGFGSPADGGDGGGGCCQASTDGGSLAGSLVLMLGVALLLRRRRS